MMTAVVFPARPMSSKYLGSGWTQVAKMTAADGATDDCFGYSVAIGGQTAVIGAAYDDDTGSSSGSAYLFQETAAGWSQAAKLVPADGEANDFFGRSVSISGATAIVGAYGDDDLGSASGSAYLFRDTASGWTEVAKLTPSDGGATDEFGGSVSISGSAVCVGASGDRESGYDSGSAYLFSTASSLNLQALSDTGSTTRTTSPTTARRRLTSWPCPISASTGTTLRLAATMRRARAIPSRRSPTEPMPTSSALSMPQATNRPRAPF